MTSAENEIKENAWSKLEEFFEEIFLSVDQTAGKLFWQEPDIDPLFEDNYEGITSYNRNDHIHKFYNNIKNLISDAEAAINVRNVESLESLLEEFNEKALEEKADFSSYYDDFNECIEIIKSYDHKIIYTPPQKEIIVPELIISANEQLINLLSKHPSLIYEISPRKFEEIIAEIFCKNGFDVQLTKSTRDGGKDIVAISKNLGIPTKYVIECKRYSRENRISIGIVQRLLGVKIGEQANKGILVTTSFFTKDAKAFADNHMWDLSLKDYDDILGWLGSYKYNA